MTKQELERRLKVLEQRCCCANEVLFYGTLAGFPATGLDGKIYVDESTGLLYTWNGTSFVLGGGSSVGYFQAGIDLVALTPFTVTHALALTNKDSYILSVKDVDGNPLEVDYIGIGVNSLSITSAVNISDISVTILGL